VANGVTISYGDVVKLTNGEFSLCASGETPFGVCKTRGDSVGNAAGTVLIEAILAHGVLWEADQGALTDAATQPGDTLDINATSDGLAASNNIDFKVYDVDRTANTVTGFFGTNQTGFPF